MTSPHLPQNDAYGDRRFASSPAPSVASNHDPHDDSIRPMRVKVLYTFDDQNKTNCLARCPRVLDIRTARLDETLQIGVVELRHCIHAIVAASPELLGKLAHDYTVYAYDYSEYETPLVGQGLLSWMLASTSSTSPAPAAQSRAIVTGRVCKNLLGMFGGDGVQETLEVKLRLVPVPTCLQSEYLESIKKYRELSAFLPPDFNHQAWSELIKSNPGFFSSIQDGNESPVIENRQQGFGIEHVQRLMNDGYVSQSDRNRPHHDRRSSYADPFGGGEGFRQGSPTPSMQSEMTQTRRPTLSRSVSRLSSHGTQPQESNSSIIPTMEGGELQSDGRADGDPPRKRAKIVKADYPGKTSFGTNADSLRVAASTAASVRVFQPTAVRPSSNPANSLEERPRVPTPVPGATNQRRRPALPTSRSNLGRESTLMHEAGYTSPYPHSEDIRRLPESDAASPETQSISMANTPEEPASSPPVMHGVPTMPRSPSLGGMPDLPDSGFASGGPLDELFGDGDDDEDRPVDSLDLEMAPRYRIRPELENTEPQPEVSLPPPKPLPSEEDTAAALKAQEISRQNARRAIGLKRSQTWAGDQHSSDPGPGSDGARRGSEAPRPKSRAGANCWNKEKRKAAIQTRLAKSVAAGEMPPYCENCGAIETPTWRKAFYRTYSGGSEAVTFSTEEGGVIGIQVLETDSDGSTKLFKLFKKSLLKTDEAFSAILLCNPCGLWLANHKCMRPESKFASKSKRKNPGDKPDRPSRSKKWKAPDAKDQSDSFIDKSDGPSPVSDGPEHADSTSQSNSEEPAGQLGLPATRRSESTSHNLPPEGNGGNNSNRDPATPAALERAIQSSPARFLGSKQSPIKVDESPESARRSLFSSPKTSGPLGINMNEHPPTRHKTTGRTDGVSSAVGDGEDQADKENMPPPSKSPDPLDELFLGVSPKTPSRTRNVLSQKSPNNPFKTPTKSSPGDRILSTGDIFSSAARVLLNPRTPSRTPSKPGSQPLTEMSPFSAQLNQFLNESNLVSPSMFLNNVATLPDMPPADAASHTFRPGPYDFSDLPTSDGPMPSSPPPEWITVFEDPQEHGNGEWQGLGFGSSPPKATISVENKGEHHTLENGANEEVGPRGSIV